jgi:hypothetical protein
LQQREQTLNTPENKQRNTGRAEVLSLERHKSLKFHTANSFSFAAPWLYVPVHGKEIPSLGRTMPILFTRNDNGALTPCLLLKAPGKSAINASGQWQAGKLPDIMRLYPFGWIQEGQGNRLTLYPEAPHFDGPGERLITSKGKPTQKLNKIMRALSPIQAAFAETAVLMQELNSLNILQPFRVSVGKEDSARAVTLWAVSDPSVLKLKISPRLRTLLYVHQQSTRRMLNTVNPAEVDQEAKADVKTTRSGLSSADNAKQDVGSLIDQACRQFGVTVDDLRSRKRSDAIKKARTALVNDAEACDCLELLAVRLERTVDTLKKWM